MGLVPFQYASQAPQYPQHHDSAVLARAQYQQYISEQDAAQAAQFYFSSSQQLAHLQTQPPFARVDPHFDGIAQPAYLPLDSKFTQQPFPVAYGASGTYQDTSMMRAQPYSYLSSDQISARHLDRSPDLTAMLSFPRGPPRKPKQSGHALWIGNLPPVATVTDLKDHFSRDATADIQSLFLISKTNCAFVNYRSEAACVAAMNRFHDSRFHGVRLVCRLRRDSTGTAGTATVGKAPIVTDALTLEDISNGIGDDVATPIIVRGSPAAPPMANKQAKPSSDKSVTKVLEKFFIVKSLTLQDLEASVRNGMWATQSHNETTLDKAYSQAENVYLVFSANKSGGYFGYARMMSPIAGASVSVESAPTPQPPAASDGPKYIPTPATVSAPRGRITDDSARGAIFWEAEMSEEEENASLSEEVELSNGSQDLGRSFKIQWMSTVRLPFYRTRGLRNPWNANREVKIARDGTELEPSVGKRLVQMFHHSTRPPPPLQLGSMPFLLT